MGGIRRILPPTCGETATFRAKLIGRPLWSDFYSRLTAIPALGERQLSGNSNAFPQKAGRSRLNGALGNPFTSPSPRVPGSSMRWGANSIRIQPKRAAFLLTPDATSSPPFGGWCEPKLAVTMVRCIYSRPCYMNGGGERRGSSARQAKDVSIACLLRSKNI